jgi:hypothetical protein
VKIIVETNQEKKLKLDSVEITEKERFRAHPIRYVLSIPFAVAEVYFLILFLSEPSWGAFIELAVIAAILSFLGWLVYGPLNAQRLKQEKQMETMAEYLRNNIMAEKKNMEYCHQCGKLIEAEWTSCPYCGAGVHKNTSV